MNSFQSLLHQGISLLACRDATLFPRRREGFNPFFIRASVYWHVGMQRYSLGDGKVSIPSSSGHQFTGFAPGTWRAARAPRFQSLLHQGISLLHAKILGLKVTNKYLRFNPFFIRASVYWNWRRPRRRMTGSNCVSIPSSSGHQFTGHAHRKPALVRARGFNPFFIRASVY